MITYETILQNPRAIIGIIGLTILILILFIWDKRSEERRVGNEC